MAYTKEKMDKEKCKWSYIEERKKGKVGELIELMLKNPMLMDCIEEMCFRNTERLILLYDILLNLGKNERDEVRDQIYLYGGLIGSQDLMARQMFLWLFGLSEKMNETRTEKEQM